MSSSFSTKDPVVYIHLRRVILFSKTQKILEDVMSQHDANPLPGSGEEDFLDLVRT